MFRQIVTERLLIRILCAGDDMWIFLSLISGPTIGPYGSNQPDAEPGFRPTGRYRGGRCPLQWETEGSHLWKNQFV